MTTFDKLTEASAFLQRFNTAGAKTAVVLGSGLGEFTKTIQTSHEIPYSDIPHFPVSTVEGHSGKLLFGSVEGKPVIAMAGRFHFYEGYTAQEVIFPIRVLKFLGVENLLLSNAAGGVKKRMEVGDLMIIKDLISLVTVNPLLGPNDERLGPRFPDMSKPFDEALRQKARDIATERGIELKEGVYFGVTGPTFETRAEYKMIRKLGGHAVGMSTVQEVIAAAHMGMKVFAMSVITDIGIRKDDNVITHAEVLEAANKAEPKLSAIFSQLIATIG